MSDKGLDLDALEALFGEGENLAHWAKRGPSGRDREEAVNRLTELLERVARYAPSRKPKLPQAPDYFHKDSDTPEDE
jgi:hypothetical protein